MKFSHYLFGLVLGTGIYTISTAGPLFAQTRTLEANRAVVSTGAPAWPPTAPGVGKRPVDATATVRDGSDRPVTVSSRKGIFGLVGLKHDHAVDIAVQYPVTKAGHRIIAEPLNGGQVIAPAQSLIVGGDGMIHFKFRAGHKVGAYQIALHDGAEVLGLQFWVLDEDHPEKNQSVVNTLD